jgi:hypothetical protein
VQRLCRVFFTWLSAKPSLLSTRKKRSAKPPALGKEADSGSELAKPSYINSRLWSEMAIQSTATYISHSAYASDAPNYKPIPNAPYYILRMSFSSQNWHARKIQVRSNHLVQIIRNTHASEIKKHTVPQAIVTLLYNLLHAHSLFFFLFASHFHVCFFTYVQLNLSHMSLYSNKVLI